MGAAAANLSATHAIPAGGAYLKVNVNGGTNNTGTVSISANVSGVLTNETLTFSAAHWYISANKYDAEKPALTSANLHTEATKPTITVTSVDASGTPSYWTSTEILYGEFRQIAAGRDILTIPAGLKGGTSYYAALEGSQTIEMGQSFTVRGYTDTYKVASDPQKHFALGTDLIDYTYFYAIKVKAA